MIWILLLRLSLCACLCACVGCDGVIGCVGWFIATTATAAGRRHAMAYVVRVYVGVGKFVAVEEFFEEGGHGLGVGDLFCIYS